MLKCVSLKSINVDTNVHEILAITEVLHTCVKGGGAVLRYFDIFIGDI
jgi:hypothetical protein